MIHFKDNYPVKNTNRIQICESFCNLIYCMKIYFKYMILILKLHIKINIFYYKSIIKSIFKLN